MSNTNFFTGKGDGGVSKINNKAFSKSSSVVELLGFLDELNSLVGFAKVEAHKFSKEKNESPSIANSLKEIQEDLFIIQAGIAARAFGYDKAPVLREEKTKKLEEKIGEIDTILPPLKKFIIPGGTELSVRLDMARTLARRVERVLKRYSEETPESTTPPMMSYMNRLSSALFAFARYVNFLSGIEEENPSYN